jgi:hypothetical protein
MKLKESLNEIYFLILENENIKNDIKDINEGLKKPFTNIFLIVSKNKVLELNKNFIENDIKVKNILENNNFILIKL